MRKASTWRPEDEALLTQLEDEALMERVWAAMAIVDAAPLHPRASGVLAELRTTVGGAVAVEQARRGELAPVLREITMPVYEDLTPALAHHLALLARAQGHHAARSDNAAQRERAVAAWARWAALWAWLGEERTYLASLGHAVVQGKLPPHELSRALDEAPLAPIRELAKRAKAGARALSFDAGLACRALAKVPAACAEAGVPDAARRTLERRAINARADAIGDAYARVDERLEDAFVADTPAADVRALLADAAAVWRWADCDEEVEREVTQRITDYIWGLYKKRDWAGVRLVLGPLEPIVDSLEQRVLGDPRKLAYASPCAQMLVFRAEMAPGIEGPMVMAERAVALCPTHRNGRLVLAGLHIDRALDQLAGARGVLARNQQRAAEDLRRAEALFPLHSRLEDAKSRFFVATGRKFESEGGPDES